MISNSNVTFIILTIIQIPSLFCAIQSIRFNKNNNPLIDYRNHVLFCLLFSSIWTAVLDLPFTQAYLWTGFMPIQTSWACTWFNFSMFCSTGMNRILMAFMCIERHFVVFRPQYYHSHRSRVIFHYLPLSITILAVIVYYLIMNVVVQCSNLNFDYSRFMCGFTCIVRQRSLTINYAWFDVCTPVILTTVTSILLPVRFILQKRSIHRLQWARSRKLIVQTVLISGAYIVCWLSYAVILQLLVNGHLSLFNVHVNLYTIYGPYITPLLTPFIIQYTASGWLLNMKNIKHIKRRILGQHSTIQPRVPTTTKH